MKEKEQEFNNQEEKVQTGKQLETQELSAENFWQRIRRRVEGFRQGSKEAREIVSSEEFTKELESEVREVGAITDTALEMKREVEKPEVVEPVISEEEPTRRKLDAKESLLEQENPLEFLAAVRVSNNLPVIEEGKLRIRTAFDETDTKVPRPTLHFTLNCRVANNDGGSWDDVSFAYVMPMDKLVEKNGKPYALGKDDTYWLTAKGLEVPEGTKIVYRGDLKDSPALNNLKKFCGDQGIDIEFIENPSTDEDIVSETLIQEGYSHYAAKNEESTIIDQKLAEKLDVKVGGYGSHHASWLHKFERTFMHGIPGYRPESLMRGDVAHFHPMDQLRILREEEDKLPQEVLDRFEQLAAKNLEYLVQGKDRVEEFAAEADRFSSLMRLDEKDTSKKLKTRFYESLTVELVDKQGYMSAFWNKHPELKSKSEQLLDEVMTNEDYTNLYEALLERQQYEVVGSLAPKFASKGGYTSFAAVEYFADELDERQVAEVRETIMGSPQLLEQGSNERLIGYLMQDLKERRGHYLEVYGEKFVKYYEEKYGKAGG